MKHRWALLYILSLAATFVAFFIIAMAWKETRLPLLVAWSAVSCVSGLALLVYAARIVGLFR